MVLAISRRTPAPQNSLVDVLLAFIAAMTAPLPSRRRTSIAILLTITNLNMGSIIQQKEHEWPLLEQEVILGFPAGYTEQRFPEQERSAE